MSDKPIGRHAFQSFDGAELSYRVEGEGRPVVMLHGFLANSRFNWIDPGVTAAIVAAGFQPIMLDLRGHGHSAVGADGALYPPDVLCSDGLALVAHLGLSDYDLVGYSLGARTAVRMLARGAAPRRCVLGGMGDSGVTNAQQRVRYFEDLIANGARSANPNAAAVVAAMIERAKLDPRAMLNVMKAQVATPAETLKTIATPIFIVSGKDDADNGSAEGLAALLPNARAERVPGNHLTAVVAPEFAAAIVDFVSA
ncbi:alpha/beta fold hydrolase [Terricaulis sp.]|uniref:alpha/beta fold hydrolase n=1 Tax=Terricaulis sp. TaxID=2768686 RepID=UPI0037844EAB